MQVSRRRLLLAAGAVAASAAAVCGGVAVSWWDEAPESGYLVLSEEEAGIFDALAEAIYPAGGDPAIGGREAQCARVFDRILFGMAPAQARLLKLALHALDSLTLPTHASRFHALPTPAATAVFQSWLVHPLAEVRGLTQSLYVFCGTAWTMHPSVSPRLAAMTRCGYGA